MFDTEIEPKNENYTEYKSIEDLFTELEKEREDVSENIEVNNNDDFFEDEIENIETETEQPENILQTEIEKSKLSLKVQQAKARAESRFLATSNDKLHSFICSIIADDEIDNYKAEEDELKEIEEAFFNWRKDSETHLPEWMQALSFITVVYTPLYIRAIKTRKLQKQNEKLLSENEKQLQELSELRKILENKIKDSDNDKRNTKDETN